MEQATLAEQKTTKRRKVIDSKNRVYADRILEKYEKKIEQVVHGKFKGATDISIPEREDIIISVCHDFWKLLASGKFKGEHEEASIKACISAIAQNKKNDFLVRFITGKKLRVYDPAPRVNTPGGGVPDKIDPMIERLPPHFSRVQTGKDPMRKYEEEERGKFIARETKYPEIIDSYRKGYSIQVIARTYGLNDEQVKKRIQREKNRLAEKAKRQGWFYKD